MSIADDLMAGASLGARITPPATPPAQPPANHRLAEVRQQQGVSVRSMARRMGVSMERVRREERPDSNPSLSDLIRWQKALEVPLIDLLIDNNAPISAPVMVRAKWLRLMKTIKALQEVAPDPSVRRMVEMLESQVTEIMPELSEVGGWHSVGQRRTQDEMGQVAENVVPTNFARDSLS